MSHVAEIQFGKRTEEPGGAERLIHQAVARQARRRPTAPALVFRGETTTYAELDRAADTCAQALLRHGVATGQVVPVLLSRSPGLVVALLGILKCGAAYTGIDHRWPAERVGSIMRALDPPVFVTDRDHSGLDLPTWRPSDAPPPEAEAPPHEPAEGVRASLPAELDDGAPATVFFTSGTTGEPKGVLSPHRATMRLFGAGGLPGFEPGRVMPQLAPVPWDAFSLELWGMLTTGGTSVIVDDDYLLPDGLRDMVRSDGVDTAWLTSSLFNFFVDEDVDCFAGMRQVLTGGERLSVAHVRRFLARHPDIALVNGYGPVESCVFVSTLAVRPADCDAPDGIPIGRPVAGTQVFLLDEGAPVQEGATGEICVAGEGLALGYLGDPATTAAKFEAVDIDGVSTRIYHTGDVGHRDAEGVLHFLGRRDRQVKIAGHRVEPGEIETAALRIPGIGQCSVVPVPRAHGVGHDRLAMFYTAVQGDTDGLALEPAGVRRSMAALLPRYMVPKTIRMVPRLPRTANGKTDHDALLASLRLPGDPDSRPAL